MSEDDPCRCGHDLIRHDMGHGCIECRCRGFREPRHDRVTAGHADNATSEEQQ